MDIPTQPALVVESLEMLNLLGLKHEVAEEIVTSLKQHDWTFEWSDDSRTYRRGDDDRKRIMQLCQNAGLSREEFNTLLFKWMAYHRVSWPMAAYKDDKE